MTSKQRDELQKISAAFIMYPVGYVLQNLQCKMSLQEIKDIVDTILATPPRNCDRFSNANEALEAFANEKGETMIEFVRWLFAEAKGETK